MNLKNRISAAFLSILLLFNATACQLPQGLLPGLQTSDSTDHSNHDHSDEPHEHTFSSRFSYDDSYHWYSATCGHDVKSNFGEHEFEWSTTVEATLTVAGEEKGVCGCGYEVTREIAATIPDFPDYETLNEIGFSCVVRSN